MAVHSRVKSLENNIKSLKDSNGSNDNSDIVIKRVYKINWFRLTLLLLAFAALIYFIIHMMRKNK